MSKSLLQGDPRRCWLCGCPASWDAHGACADEFRAQYHKSYL